MSINSINGNTALESGSFPPVRAATTAAIVLTGLQTIDTVALAAGDRVLVMNQADQTTNGIYAASTGNWVRTSDAAGNQQFFSGMVVTVALGAVNAGLTFLCTCTDDPVVVGTSAITFASQAAVQTAQFSATSTTSLTIATGLRALAIQAGKAFQPGQWVLIQEQSNSNNQMLGQISSYSGGALSVQVTAIGGSGTHADWTVVLTNSAAAAGFQPPIGGGNVTGPGTAFDGHIALFNGATGQLIKDSGVAVGTLAQRANLLYGDAGAASIGAAALAPGAAPLPSITNNLVVANNVSNPTRDLDVSPGRVRDDTDATNLQLFATITKRFNGAFAPGTNAGVLASGSNKLANKTYHDYLIGRLGLAVTSRQRATGIATLAVAAHGLGVGSSLRGLGIGGGYDVGAAVSAVPDADHLSYANAGPDEAPTAVTASIDGFDVCAERSDVALVLPTGWTVKQVLRSELTDGSANLRTQVQTGDFFRLATPTLDINTSTLSTFNSVSFPISVPLGVSVEAHLSYAVGQPTIGAAVYFRCPSDADTAVSLTAAPVANAGINVVATVASEVRVWTDTSGNVAARSNAANTSVVASVLGYRDPRRRLF